MANSFVYAIKEFKPLSSLTEADLNRFQNAFDQGGGNYPPDPYTAIIVRNSIAMDKGLADQIVSRNPHIRIDGLPFDQGAIIGAVPGHSGQASSDKAFVYAIRSFDNLSALTIDEVNLIKSAIKNEFGTDPFACLLFRKGDINRTPAQTDEDVNQDPIVTIGDDTFDQGSIKGTPPGNTAAFPTPGLVRKTAGPGYVIRQFNHAADMIHHKIGHIKSGYPIYLHYFPSEENDY